VAGDEPLHAKIGEGGDGGLDDRLEHGPGQVEAADESGDPVTAGQAPSVAEDVDGAGVRAGRHHHQALAGDVDDQVLVVQDQRVGLQVGPAGWGQAQLGPGGEGDLALAPGLRVDQQGQAAQAGPGDQALQAAVVVDVAVGDDDGPQPGQLDLQDVEVVGQAVWGSGRRRTAPSCAGRPTPR
jgi:hypothetical protein